MTTIETLVNELEREAQTTRKMLSLVPADKFDWQPHVKSMKMKALATHIAELPAWIGLALNTDGLDFAVNAYDPVDVSDTAELLEYFEQNIRDGKTQLEKADETTFSKPWTLRNGEQIHMVNPKSDVMRMTYCQIVHHRAQLGVYLRLLNIPIPGSYGPSADEQGLK